MNTPIGIDPASGKDTCIWINDSFKFVKPQKVRREIETLCNEYDKCVIAWDAPISFSLNSYSDRLIDKAARAWVKEKVDFGSLKKKRN